MCGNTVTSRFGKILYPKVKEYSPKPYLEQWDIEEIKKAFWLTFHKSGEIWFGYIGTEEECTSCTEWSWSEFCESLGIKESE